MELHPIIEKFVKKRGFEVKDLIKYNREDLPNPEFIPNIGKFKEVLESAKRWNSQIILFGDFDMDGITSSTIYYKTLQELGLNIDCMISTRQRDGYGLSKAAIDEIDRQGHSLIITTDCGITQDEEIQYAEDKGIEVFVLDHHNRSDNPSFNYIDLKVNQGFFPTKELSAGGLAYFISKYLIGYKADKFLDLAGFSTIADLVDLTNKTNRILATEGMRNVQNEGLKALIMIKGLDPNDLNESDIGYSIAPCINAVGRLKDNYLSFKMLTTEDRDERFKLAKRVNKINEIRKTKTEKVVKEVEENVDLSNNIIVHQANIEKGLTGLVAGKLMNKYGKPAVIINSEGKGSGRSLEPFNFQEELQNHLDIIDYAAGHSKAFGIGLEPKYVDELRIRLSEITENIEYQTIDYDIELKPTEVNDQLLKSMDRIRPFGIGFQEPKFAYPREGISNVKHLSGGKHVKFRWFDTEAIWFNSSEKEIYKNDRLVYTPGYNTYMGRTNIQLMIKGGL